MVNTERQQKHRAMLAMQRRAWEQGVAAQALLESGETDLALLLAKDAVVNQLKDGRLGLNEGKGPVADPAANGEPVLFASQVTGEKNLQKAAERMLDFLLCKAPKTRDGIIYHNYIENMLWVDAMYMVPPFLASRRASAEAVKQIVGYRKALINPEMKLYYHIWDEDNAGVRAQTVLGVAMAGRCRDDTRHPRPAGDDER
jgi:rhamnogalacturonyl hydrolase YesR